MTEIRRVRLLWLCSEVMRISSVLSGLSWSLLWTKWTFVCRRSYPVQRCLLCVCKLSVKHRKMSTEMAEASSILFGRLVDIVVTLECSVLYLAPIKTMHSTWKCLYLFTWRTCYCILTCSRCLPHVMKRRVRCLVYIGLHLVSTLYGCYMHSKDHARYVLGWATDS